jgi:hypothetical protein
MAQVDISYLQLGVGMASHIQEASQYGLSSRSVPKHILSIFQQSGLANSTHHAGSVIWLTRYDLPRQQKHMHRGPLHRNKIDPLDN